MRNSEGLVKPPTRLRSGADYVLDSAGAERLRYVEGSARVLRWHTETVHHRQTVGEHTYTVMQLVLLLTRDEASRELLVAGLRHDTAEQLFGDVPAPTKKLSGMKDTLDGLEDTFMREIGLNIPVLEPFEAKVLKMADSLEGCLFCASELRRGNRELQRGFANYLNYIRTLLEAWHPETPMDFWAVGYAECVYNNLYKEYTNVFG